MSTESEPQPELDDLELTQRLRNLPGAPLDVDAERRIRSAVLKRISDSGNILDWLLRPLWRPVLALLLPFATGLAFGQSDYLGDNPMLVEEQGCVELLTTLDAAQGLFENFAAEEEIANVD